MIPTDRCVLELGKLVHACVRRWWGWDGEGVCDSHLAVMSLGVLCAVFFSRLWLILHGNIVNINNINC
jgi:hypothetical protein